jgi:putative addiction module component (TIGR02574 family)
MTKIELRERLFELSDGDRLEIADEIWGSLSDRELLPVPAWQQDLLAERLAVAEGDPGVDWEEFRATLRKKP